MISKPFDSIDKQDIEFLIENKVREGKTIEYKGTLPGNSDKDKREFLADVSAFANAGGGDLIYGIIENDGIPKEAIGLDCNNIDSERCRLENIIRDGLSPRVQGIKMKVIEGFEKGPVLLIRIPSSWTAPHMISFKNTSRFFTRNSTGKHQMDVTEIRTAFLQSETLLEKIKCFRDERVGKIIADETPVPLIAESRLILHIMPVSSFATMTILDISGVKKDYINSLPPIDSASYRNRFNIDGLLTYEENSKEGRSWSYCQLFRYGQIEAVYADLVREHNGRRVIPSEAYEKYIVKATLKYFEVLRTYEVQGPLMVSICLIGIKGVYMGVRRPDFDSGEPIDRDMLILPDISIQEYEVIKDRSVLANHLRPIFDALWNACGFERSFNYDEDGNWKL